MKKIEKMLKQDVVKTTTTDWASSLVVVSKIEGSLRLCVDYRKSNAITVRDIYPLARIDGCIDQ